MAKLKRGGEEGRQVGCKDVKALLKTNVGNLIRARRLPRAGGKDSPAQLRLRDRMSLGQAGRVQESMNFELSLGVEGVLSLGHGGEEAVCKGPGFGAIIRKDLVIDEQIINTPGQT